MATSAGAANARRWAIALACGGLALFAELPCAAEAQATPPGCAAQRAPTVRRLPMPPPPRAVVGAGMALGVLNLPNIAAGPALFAELDAGWPLDIELAYLPANRAELSDSDLDLGLYPFAQVPFPEGGSRLVMSLVQATVATCPLRHHLSSGRLLGCGGLYGGVLHGKGEGLIAQSAETRPLFGAELYARWHFYIAEPFGITYSAGVFVPFLRERFGYLDRRGEYREKFQEPVIGGRLDIALSWAFE